MLVRVWWCTVALLATVESKKKKVTDEDLAGTCLEKFKEYEGDSSEASRLKAVDACRAAGRKDPGVLVLLSKALLRDEDGMEEGVAALEAAVVLEPLNGDIRLDLARAYAGKYAATREGFDVALETAREAADLVASGAMCTVGQLLAETDDKEAAIEAFEVCAEDLDDDDAPHSPAERSWMLFEFARLLDDAGRLEDAAIRYSEAAEKAPEFTKRHGFDHKGEALAGKALTYKKIAIQASGGGAPSTATKKAAKAVVASVAAYVAAIDHVEGTKQTNPALLLSLGEILEAFQDDKAGSFIAARWALWSFLSTSYDFDAPEVLVAAAEVLADRGDIAIAQVAIDFALQDLIPPNDNDMKSLREKALGLKDILPNIEKQALDHFKAEARDTTPAYAAGGEVFYDALDTAFADALKAHTIFNDLAKGYFPPSKLTWREYQKRRRTKVKKISSSSSSPSGGGKRKKKKKTRRRRKKKTTEL